MTARSILRLAWLTVALSACASAPEVVPPPPDASTVARLRAMRRVPIRDRFARARVDLLRAINADRASAGLQPVALDSLASVAAQRHAEAMAEGNFFSHYDPDGEAILDPHRTGVGIGFAVDRERRTVYVVQEFVSHHAAVTATGVATDDVPARLRGRVLRGELAPLLVVVRREPVARPWERLGSPPPGPYDDGGVDPKLVPPWDFTWLPDGSFALELGEDLPPGRYYAVLYVAPTIEVKAALARRRAYPRQGWPGAAFLFEVRPS